MMNVVMWLCQCQAGINSGNNTLLSYKTEFRCVCPLRQPHTHARTHARMHTNTV